MAIMNTLAGGHWAKTKTLRLRSRHALVLVLLMFGSGTGLGLAMTAGVAANDSIGRVMACLGTTLLCGAAFILCWPRFSRRADRLHAERFRLLRGGHAEKYVGSILSKLDDSWVVFNNLQLDPASERDIDHIVVGPRGLFVISTKSKRGHLTLTPRGDVRLNGRPTRFVASAYWQALHFKERLADVLKTDVPYVHAVLAMPFAWTDVPLPCNNVIVGHMENLQTRIESAAAKSKPIDQARVVEAIYRVIEQGGHETSVASPQPQRLAA